MKQVNENDIAIIGMAGRFPDAKNIQEYWQNLVDGVNSINEATEEEIIASGVSKEMLNHKRFVNASSKLADAKYFDADFFGLANSEATIMDPQIRLLLQTSWHAIEDAGYDVNRLEGSVGNFCGMSTNSYLMSVLKSSTLNEQADLLLYRILNEKDFLATWISYKLNLTGPAFSVQTACSTSLLAVHLACQSLLSYECDMALAGGVSFDSDERVGYIHMPESIYSKDGVCRPFDSKASGTISGDGVGSIVLKRATDAVRDNDHIYALIKGSAVNNDGANKQGYTTPSVDFQRDVVLEALSIADINPETIGMIEAHGTGTYIGDPIEVSALTEAFREFTNEKQYCAIGSVKSNIGHLDAAAGIASIIKAALCVNKGILVPSLNFSEANPALNLNTSPFYVSQENAAWPEHFELRRAGITSLGVGGTNVHVIIEQPPVIAEKEMAERPYIVALSSLNEENLQQQKQKLAEYIDVNPNVNLADLEFTSLYGRKVMPHKFSTVCRDAAELKAQLKGTQNDGCYVGYDQTTQNIFMFPGQGSQYTNMALELYQNNEAFKNDMDYCFGHLKSLSQTNFKEIIFSEESDLLDQTENTQVALFIVEYCLAKELMRNGIKPNAIIGHSLGEYVAACIAGCISLDDALKLVYHRGRLMGSMEEGAMLLVQSTEENLKSLLLDPISVCAFNTDESIVIGGPKDAIQTQSVLLEQNSIGYRKLKVSHAYHTQMMRNALAEFETVLSQVEFKSFDTVIFSTFTGNQVEPSEFCSVAYWLDQIIHPVKFVQAAKSAADYFSNPVFIEVGPGNGLSSFVKTIFNNGISSVNLLPKPSNNNNSVHNLYTAKAILFAKGLVFDLPEAHDGKRISMPGYAFSKTRFWKPKATINYDNFSEITTSYHYTEDKYQRERLRSTIEIELGNTNTISAEILKNLNDLHTEYLNNIKKLFPSENSIDGRVEAMYDEILPSIEKVSSDTINFNEKRNVSSVFVAPATNTEKIIAEHWGSILGYQPVGILDNYFEVGGNSLLATKLLTQLSDEFEITLVFRELSECVSIKELAVLIDSKNAINELVESIEIENNTIDNNFIEL
ncbi:acyltransferase domain-containing protein [Flavobacterium amniphilum]|uniref:type I polyketide synthase n=1 Tax=Flavobacterium amniphilum TaxID=1834035 RepID=UPI00202A7B6E|nr:type I polyketide synthase [Flavobacterium amniphilum]MCL9807485.1 acyltransferase domain-containing protein [Flavobacterium amniphilum]